ncbi:MAG: BMP family lipoprotein [Actinomycetota bacterium]
MLTRKKRWFVVLFVVLAMVAAACGEDDADTTDTGDNGDTQATSDIRVGVAFDVGGLGDQSFNDAANRGLQQAIDDGLVAEENTELIEPNATGSNRDDNVVLLADQGFDVILAIGFAFSEGVAEIAPDYPDQSFAIVDGFATFINEDLTNVADLTFKEHEGSYLVGAAAAMKTEVGTVGFLGGQQGTGLIERFQAGFEAGVAEIDPNIEVLVEYIGDDVTAFNDPTRGEALSSKMFDDGADIIYHAAGASGAGLFTAAVAADGLAIGVDSDQSLTASPEQQELIITSMLKRVDTAVYDAIEATANDAFQAGFQVFGLAEEGVDYAVNEFNDNPELLSDEIQARLDELKQAIIDGEIEVPDTVE